MCFMSSICINHYINILDYCCNTIGENYIVIIMNVLLSS